MPGLKVIVEYLGHIRNVLGNRRIEEIDMEDNSSVTDLFMMLSERYGEPFKKAVYESGGADVKSNFIATVNGLLLNQLDGVKTRLRNGDHVVLMPVVSGG